MNKVLLYRVVLWETVSSEALEESSTCYVGNLKVTVYSLLMKIFFCFWVENLMLAQISVIDCNSAPKIMSCSE